MIPGDLNHLRQFHLSEILMQISVSVEIGLLKSNKKTWQFQNKSQMTYVYVMFNMAALDTRYFINVYCNFVDVVSVVFLLKSFLFSAFVSLHYSHLFILVCHAKLLLIR